MATRTLHLILAFLWLAAAALPAQQADEPRFNAALSKKNASVGEQIVLELTATGGDREARAPRVEVDGLDIRFLGSQSSYQVRNFEVSSSITYRYVLTPLKEGKFTIPSIRIHTAGKMIGSEPITLNVKGKQTARGNRGGGGSVPQGGGAPADEEAPSAFGEWVLPKTKLYVGETIPAEFRIYVSSDYRWNIQPVVSLPADGFTMQKLPEEPETRTITREGRSYDLFAFPTTLTAVKAGTLTLDGTERDSIAESRHRPSQRQTPNGFPPDIFDDFFSFPAMPRRQRVMIASPKVEVEVKALPTKDQPKDFTGAIGQFTMKTSASPLKLKAGDPITLKAEISGIGNFERVGAPVAAQESGWRSYPPSNRFEKTDEVGLSGTKTFEMALIPEAGKTQLPEITFSYFDPSKEKYFTLKGDPITVQIEGTAPAAALAAATPQGSPAAAATPAPAGDDLLPLRTDRPFLNASFRHLWDEPGFWLVQLAPLAAFLALIGWKRRQRRLGDRRALRVDALRAARRDAVRAFESAASPAEAYGAAITALRTSAALTPAALDTEREPETFDLDAVTQALRLDGETASETAALFAAHDRLRYAGTGPGPAQEPLSPERRTAVAALLNQTSGNR